MSGDGSPPIPDRLAYRIGEIAEIVGVEPHVLRYWETEFRIRPQRSPSGQRMYRRKDLDKFLRIKRLLHEQGYTIAGARKALASDAAADTPGEAGAEIVVEPAVVVDPLPVVDRAVAPERLAAEPVVSPLPVAEPLPAQPSLLGPPVEVPRVSPAASTNAPSAGKSSASSAIAAMFEASLAGGPVPAKHSETASSAADAVRAAIPSVRPEQIRNALTNIADLRARIAGVREKYGRPITERGSGDGESGGS